MIRNYRKSSQHSLNFLNGLIVRKDRYSTNLFYRLKMLVRIIYGCHYATPVQGRVCYDCFGDEKKTRVKVTMCACWRYTCAEYNKVITIFCDSVENSIRSMRSKAMCVTMKTKYEKSFATRLSPFLLFFSSIDLHYNFLLYTFHKIW